MKTSSSAFLLAPALLLALTATPVVSASENRPPIVQGAWRDLVMETIADVLRTRWEHPLSAEQRTQLQTIFASRREEIFAQARRRLEAQRVMRSVVLNPASEDALVRSAAHDVAQALEDGAVLRHRLAREAMPILSEAQRDAWREVINRFDDRLDALLETSH